MVPARVAEALHDEKGLRVTGHPPRSQPGPQVSLLREVLASDAQVPGLHILAGALLEQAGGHLFHALPVARLAHRNLPRAENARSGPSRGLKGPGSPGRSSTDRRHPDNAWPGSWRSDADG